MTAKLVLMKTRTRQSFANRFAKLAASRDRSVAAEMRVALERHLAESNGERQS